VDFSDRIGHTKLTIKESNEQVCGELGVVRERRRKREQPGWGGQRGSGWIRPGRIGSGLAGAGAFLCWISMRRLIRAKDPTYLKAP